MRILTAGTATTDIITLVSSENIERMTMHNATESYLLMEQGRKLDAEQVLWGIGGGAVNAAVCLRKLGHELAVFAKIGQDTGGNKIRDTLADYGIETRHIVQDAEAPTATAVMLSSHDRNPTTITYRAANALMTEADIPAEAFAGLDLLYVTNLSNRSADLFPRLVRLGQEGGAKVAVNPGIRQLTSHPRTFLDNLAYVDALSLNRVEAAALVPGLIARLSDSGNSTAMLDGPATKPTLLRTGLEFGGYQCALADFFHWIHGCGPALVIVTDGAEGAYASCGGQLFYGASLKTAVAGTAGAGDAFASTLVGYWAEGAPIDEALRAATVNACSVVAQIDTQSGLLQRAALTAMVEEKLANLPVQTWSFSAVRNNAV